MRPYGKRMKKLTEGLMQLSTSLQVKEEELLLESIHDARGLELCALDKLPENIGAFFSRRAGDGITFGEKASAFEQIKLLPRVLRNVEQRPLSATVLNQAVNFPLLIAPMAFQQLAHPDGEVATTKAAHEHKIPMVVSTLSTFSFEEIKQNANPLLWFQLCIYKDRKIKKNLARLAEHSGFKGIVLTVDAPLYGKRTKELHHPLTLPPYIEVKNLQQAGLNLKEISSTRLPSSLSSLLDFAITWEDICWLHSFTPLPIILKEIMNPKDIQIAMKHNIQAIIISNHGGRQLDTVLSSIEALKHVKIQ